MWASPSLAETSRNLPSFVVTKAIRCTDPATRSPSLSRSPRRPLSPSSGGTPGAPPDSTTRPVRARSRVLLEEMEVDAARLHAVILSAQAEVDHHDPAIADDHVRGR